MSNRVIRTVGNAVGERVSGGRPGPMRSCLTAIVAGVGAAVITYKALRK